MNRLSINPTSQKQYILPKFHNDVENINNFLLMNDAYGNPKKENFMYNNMQIFCSPTSLRYVLHSLLILKSIKNNNSKKIVVEGCGFVGLFLGDSLSSSLIKNIFLIFFKFSFMLLIFLFYKCKVC